ncbi:hypothetical protein PPMP20_22425 [Paraburkholderia phymatum]|uniref:Uncharacterized protein n=1 Tax=Paraburkholderia phymatum (strain DSM 17167 / CIP 108236 / LMG 21445 / STM815) TaxID=391038 RepID=B2JNI8_PARP8|nr:hypothetical protein [Paraburkholderia phymatum]ACC74490.1 conserved hypothetical protein [Paraburkholderia phymatum STM815]
MTIAVMPGDRRDIAETLGRYFDVRRVSFRIEELSNGVLYIGFDADGQRASVTVSFDDEAFDAYTQWDMIQKRRSLACIAVEFEKLMQRRNTTALAGDFRIDRF